MFGGVRPATLLLVFGGKSVHCRMMHRPTGPMSGSDAPAPVLSSAVGVRGGVGEGLVDGL